jgi:stalled ribosome alternative rescue factor ArfA
MGVLGPKKETQIENMFPDPFFSKRVKKDKKGTIYSNFIKN